MLRKHSGPPTLSQSRKPKIDGPVPYCAKFAVPANDKRGLMVLVWEWLKNVIEKWKWELPKVDGNVLKQELKTEKPDDRLLVYTLCCHGARMTQNQELSQLWSTSWDLHGSDLICIDWSPSKPLNLTSATFLNHSTHLDSKLHFKGVFWWFWLKFLVTLNSFAYVNPSAWQWKHICINFLYFTTNSRTSACDQSPITKQFHRELLLCNDQLIDILKATVAWL